LPQLAGSGAWPEVTRLSDDDRFDRVDRLGDLFEPVLRGGQALGPALRELR
jgi:hypothetical protein